MRCYATPPRGNLLVPHVFGQLLRVGKAGCYVWQYQHDIIRHTPEQYIWQDGPLHHLQLDVIDGTGVRNELLEEQGASGEQETQGMRAYVPSLSPPVPNRVQAAEQALALLIDELGEICLVHDVPAKSVLSPPLKQVLLRRQMQKLYALPS